MGRSILVLSLAALLACESDPGRAAPYVLQAPTATTSAPVTADVPSAPVSAEVPAARSPTPLQPSAGAARADEQMAGALRPDAAAPAAPAVPAFEPSRKGDAERGRMLVFDNGTPEAPIMSCGVPEALVRLARLDREWASALKLPERRDAELPYDLNYVTRPSGVRVIASNCLLCHASKLEGRLVIGLPNVGRDFTQPDQLSGLGGASLRLVARAALNTEEERELGRLLRVVDVVSRFPRPDTVGINPADGLFGALTMHRDPTSLVWNERADPAAGGVPARILFSDVPAWWNTWRRAQLFHTGFARGDRARIMMTSALLCLDDSAEAARIDAYFPDVQAYIESLRAPRYADFAPHPVADDAAARGRSLYRERCQSCHGGKAEEGDVPRGLIALERVGTDPVYAQVTQRDTTLPEARTIAYYFDFFNRSWYGQAGATAQLVRPEVLGYVPPPLDGVWATAPYFHNGSVPTLEGVLDPARRPLRFKRSFDGDDYDFEQVGWPYTEVAAKNGDAEVYDTTRLGNSNVGHDFSSDLAPQARHDLLEYLKTF